MDIDNPRDRAAAREEAGAALDEALHEIKRVIVGQDAMLERLMVALMARGHVLLEGVPGLAKTLTVKTLAILCGIALVLQGAVQIVEALVLRAAARAATR